MGDHTDGPVFHHLEGRKPRSCFLHPFEASAIDRVYDLTRGQPWLVNAHARQLVQVVAPDPTQVIGLPEVEAARRILISRQDTHLDSLAERMREPRVRQVIGPMLAGTMPAELPKDDVQFLNDLGLLRRNEGGGLDVANPIYREVLVEEPLISPRAAMHRVPATWMTADGRLDRPRLMGRSSASTPSAAVEPTSSSRSEPSALPSS